MILTTGDALLADILSHPEDDGLRLIYADWLEENGQAERGEFIRVQIALATWPCECDEVERVYHPECRCKEKGNLQRRQAHLLTSRIEYRDEYNRVGATYAMYAWVPRPLWRFNAKQWTFSRGFMSSVRLSQQAWLDHGRQIVQAQPVERAVLGDREPRSLTLEKVWARSTLGNLRHYIDPRIFDFLRGGQLLHPYSDDLTVEIRIYKAAEDPVADLSQACLAYARSTPVSLTSSNRRPSPSPRGRIAGLPITYPLVPLLRAVASPPAPAR